MTTRRPDAPSNMMHDDDAPPASGLSSMQRAILTIQKMRTKIESLERARVEPIAIIGMGCRFPGGASTPEAFFRILMEGVDAVTEVPPERWKIDAEEHSTDPEARAVRFGAFLRDVDLFDAGFFGISPREASKMDPQQRLLLEVTWAALERAGQLPERLVNSRTGVFLGVMTNDYAELSALAGIETEDVYTTTGNGHCFPAGRISYTFGFQGPSVAVDTACSSSLVALHLACQSLRVGECNLAVAGGVNLMLVPSTTRKFAKTSALSPDGRCKTFDATANGFVRGEGCGMLVLKRLSDAERDGDPILALIRGSAVNQDGRSTGLTTPNVLAQQSMLKQALENARVAPSDIGYVEAHGTGTPLGDPIEVEALKTVLGGPREKGSVCVLGAVKTNIGHLEAAAGVAGVMKVVLALQNELIPGNLHFRALNPRIDFRGTTLEIAREPMPWKSGMRPRFAGVSSFGLSGTNAHVVVEEAPRNLEETLGKEAGAYLLPISAKTPEALADRVRAYQKMLSSPESPKLLDIIHTASSRRSHFEHRLGAVGRSKDELAVLLGAYLRGEAPAGVVQGKATPARAKVVFVFSGQGSQWAGMGKKLYDEESSFRSVIDSCDALLMGRLGWSLLDELDSPEPVSRLGETQVAQPIIFVIQIALVELLRSWGISPDAVIGHGVGEIAAAHIAGILSLDEAIRLVAIRGRIMQKASGLGRMVSVVASREAVRKAIEGYEGRLSIAALSAPGTVVLAGETMAMDEVVAKLERDGIACRTLRTNAGFHSPQMDPLAAELVERLVRVDARRATLAMYSTVLAECVDGKELDVRYWGRNIRETVDFAGAVASAIHDGYQLFFEIGPHPELVHHVDRGLAAKKVEGLAVASLARDKDDRRALFEAAAALYTRGCALEWPRLVPAGGKTVPLPTYPFQRERFWVELPKSAASPSAHGKTHGRHEKIVFVFPGQGSQWLGMGRKLLAEEPAFRDSIKSSDVAIQAESGFSVLSELEANEASSRLREIDVVQPVLFAVEVALAALFKARGVRPDCVVGHSMGEVAAAHVAGILSLEDAAKIICRRSRLLRRVSGKGAMALVELSVDDAAKSLAGYEDRLSVAVSNGPRATVIAGDTHALDELLGVLEKRGVFCKRVKVDVASHSPQVDPLKDELLDALKELHPVRGGIAMRSTVTGELVVGEKLWAPYWADNLRAPVLFSQVTRKLVDEGHAIFVEMSPHPILLPSIEENLSDKHHDGAVIAAMRREADEKLTFEAALDALRERGAMEGLSVPPDRRVLGHSGSPLLGARFRSFVQPSAYHWEAELGVAEVPWLADHTVRGAVVFPGTGYVEMALEAGVEVMGALPLVLEGVSFEQMLTLSADTPRVVQVALAEEGTRRASVVIGSRDAGPEERWVRHSAAVVTAGAQGASDPTVSLPAIERRCSQVVEPSDHYARLAKRGLHYGAAFRGIRKLSLGDGEAFAWARLSGELPMDEQNAHPALLDACFQVAASLLPSEAEKDTYVPVRIARFGLLRRLPREVMVHARRTSSSAEGGVVDFDIVIVDEAGHKLLDVNGLSLQRIESKPERDPLGDCVFVVEWRKKELEASASPPGGAGAWLLFLDGAGTGAATARQLRERGETCIEVAPGSAYERVDGESFRLDAMDASQLRRFFGEVFSKQSSCKGVVCFQALDASPWEQTSAETLSRDIRAGTLSAVRIAQALLKQGFRDVPRLFLVTRGAQAVGREQPRVSVAQSPLWGLGRTIALEHPELECARIDLDPRGGEKEGSLLMAELLGGDDEDQVAFRMGERFVARLVRGRLGAHDDELELWRSAPARGRPFRLETTKPGVLERLVLREMTRRAPGRGEVEIEVEAAGLNFIDVLKSMGIYPGMDPRRVELGAECAGRIVAVGEGVTEWSVGDEVIAYASSCIASHVVTKALFVVRKPPTLSFAQAAVIPGVFATVLHALHHVGRLSRGEKILIHSATGGTGLAAIQYAKAVGAEIFATAGTEEKRAYLRSLGVEHVMDSRSLSFAHEILERTNGRGVNVVLNSLTGDALVKSLEVTAPFGRFLELGKKDIYDNTRLGMSPFRKSLSYTAIDLVGLSEEQPELFGALLREVMARFDDGTFHPEPVEVFSASAAVSAFQRMAQAKHMGKLAIAMTDPEARIEPKSDEGAKIRADATYLITGGLSGLGLSLARRLVELGARHVALVARSAPSEIAAAAIRVMSEAGAEVRVFKADVSRSADVEAVFSEVARSMPPLRGVVHSAAVLADRTFVDMDEEHLLVPMAPKVIGGWNLHRATRGLDLDFFVVYSSVAGLLGTPGQAGYSAANTFLDALSRARTLDGLSATSVQWGPFAGIGLAAAQDNRGDRLSAQGMEGFSPEEGNLLFERLIGSPKAEVAFVRFSVRQWIEAHPQLAGAPFLSALVEEGAAASRAAPSSLIETLRMAEPMERASRLERHVLEQLGKVVRMDPARIDPSVPFSSLGVDSLMSLELRNRIESSLGLRLSSTLLFTYPNVVALSGYLLTKVELPVETSASRAADAPAPVVSLAPIEPGGGGSGDSDDDLLAAFDASVGDLPRGH